MRRHATRQQYDGRIAVVTGASSGIGRRVARDLAARGAVVIGIARRADLLATLQAELQATSSRSRTVICDVSDTDAFCAVLRTIEREHGHIDILINDAGIEQPTPAAEGFGPTYRRILDVNFFGLAAGTLAVLPDMIARRSGIVVNVSSDVARAPEPREAAYAASKAAVSAFTESIAHEVAPQGVHVHVLYPAWVPTAMGLSGDHAELPPKPVRRTEEQVSDLLLARMGRDRIEINAAALPLLAPIGRTLAPRAYQRGMRRFSNRDVSSASQPSRRP